MTFEVVGEIGAVETIAKGSGVKVRLALSKLYRAWSVAET